MRMLKIVLLAGALTGLTAAGAMASGGGGGGGGGGEMPSASAPQYNAAEEYNKAVLSLQAKDYKSAARAAEHVTQVAPKNIDGWRLLGVAQSGSANWKGARKAYERAVKLSPDDLPSRAGLGLALANLKDPKAQEQLDWLKAKAASCTGACSPAQLQSLTTEVEKAVSAGGGAAGQASAALEQGALLFAAQGDRAYVQAVSLINEKRYDEALASLNATRAAEFYEQALALAPNHRGATEYYGELKVERGDRAGAQAMLAKLDRICAYGCAEAEELRRWIDAGGQPGR